MSLFREDNTPNNFQNLCPVSHLQNVDEIELFLSFYRVFSPEKVCEIGSFAGATLWAWIKFSKNLKSITSIDLPIGPGDGRYNLVMESRSKWKGWINLENQELNVIEGNSMDQNIIKSVYDLYPEKDLDFLMIDGDHAYSSVRADYYNYRDLVRPGGWIVFHDTYGYPDIRRLFDEVKKDGLHFEIYNPGGWGISTIIKQ